jgi:hypothetical protein
MRACAFNIRQDARDFAAFFPCFPCPERFFLPRHSQRRACFSLMKWKKLERTEEHEEKPRCL